MVLSGGVSTIDREFSQISLQGPKSIIGRGMVIADRPDNLGQASDEVSMRNGKSGIALQCGVVAVAP